ncbi:MAG: glycoside hydrolase family 99-like domain-containing protein [Alphaproteobacteria bacterium]|nr:glycoside hydrolase family 99-like domain-containing protein [Alphaproteobacteria bacterium]
MSNFIKKLFIKKTATSVRYRFLGITIIKITFFPSKKIVKFLGIKFSIKNTQSKSLIDEYIQYISSPFSQKDFVPITNSKCNKKIDAKVIAFYLPQYHSIELNDIVHGKGFTEWNNVSKTIPYYTGHYQPHIPYDLGFYNLSSSHIMHRQVELAKLYGIDGFCFHYYWFSGKRLLETPIMNWLDNKKLDFPFCLCWANENWSKLWDGGNKEIIMPQNHKEDDDEKFFYDILPFFKDNRYIRIDNKPLFILYRANLFSDEHIRNFRNTMEKLAIENGFNGIYFSIVHTSSCDIDSYKDVFDSIIEFPPHQMNNLQTLNLNNKYVVPNFKCQVFNIADYVNNKKYIYETPYRTFKSVFPSWDNSARKAFSNGYVFHNSSPNLYKKWLKGCIEWEQENNPKNEQFIFVNAWNEWAEGAHLEPDTRYGYAYLQATKDVIEDKVKNILLISHDLSISGASMSLFGIAKILKKQGNIVHFHSLSNGPLSTEIHSQGIDLTIENKEISNKLASDNFDLVICNTILTYRYVKKCIDKNIPYIWYIREALEIPSFCKKYHGLTNVLKKAKNIVTVSEYAKQHIVTYNKNVKIIHNFVEDTFKITKKRKKQTPLQFTIVGYFTPRKAFHICIDAFMSLDRNIRKNAVLNIVGKMGGNTKDYWKPLFKKTKKIPNIIWHNEVTGDIKQSLFENTDVFVVPSFDESCSRIVLEATMLGKPCIISENIGAKYMINENTGWICETGNIEALSSLMKDIISDKYNLTEMGNSARQKYIETSTPDVYEQNLNELIQERLKYHETYK